jgi:hypothetical protein
MTNVSVFSVFSYKWLFLSILNSAVLKFSYVKLKIQLLIKKNVFRGYRQQNYYF